MSRITFFILLILLSKVSSDYVEVSINGTVFLGKKLFTVFEHKPYAAFWKVPYAEPPVNKLRFKPPKEVNTTLNGRTYNYTKAYRKSCATLEDEDCLYLSIFTPLTTKELKIPVMVWIHEHSNSHGPDFLINEDVIVVIVTYRTGIFGFLNTGDAFAQGNMGAKDIVAALKWLKKNIHRFNGDQNRITIFGSGTSGVLVGSILLSPSASDLVSRVIIQSGSALSSADYKQYEFEILNELFWRLSGISDKLNRKVLYDLLSIASTKYLTSISKLLFDSTEVRDSQRLINSFGPTVESNSHEYFVNKNPSEVYKRKMAINNIDVMIGYTSLESIYKLAGLAKNKNLLPFLNNNFQYLLPFEGKSDEYESPRYKKIRRRIMDFYFLNGTITEKSFRRYAKYFSDQVIFGVVRQARLHAESSCRNVYLYRFSYNGKLNIGWKSSVGNLSFSGATSGDEICYLFKCDVFDDLYETLDEKSDIDVLRRMVKLWTNFAKFGNPTPQSEETNLGILKWNPLRTSGSLNVMKLDTQMKMVKAPEEKRYEFWNALNNEFFQ